MPCDGEGGDLTWTDFNSDRGESFTVELVLLNEWLLNNKESCQFYNDDYYYDSDHQEENFLGDYEKNNVGQNELRVSYSEGQSPYENLLFVSVGGAMSESVELDDHHPRYIREESDVTGARYGVFDSSEDMTLAFTSIESLSENINSHRSSRSIDTVPGVPDLKDGVFTIEFNVGENRYAYKIESMLIDLDGIWSRVSFSNEKETKQELVEKRKKATPKFYLMDDDTTASIFEFIDIKSLIGSCSFVCPQWHKIILYNTNTMNQIFMSRTCNYFKGSSSIEKLNQWYGLDWLETYFVSGMYQFELFGEIIRKEITRLDNNDSVGFFYLVMKLNPLQNLRFLPKSHVLIQKLSRHAPKTVMLSSNTIESVTNRYIGFANINHFVNMELNSNPLRFLERSLYCVNKTPLETSKNLSVDMINGIPLYVNFLKSLSEKISPLVRKSLQSEEVDWIGSCLIEMSEKAKYFLEHIATKLPCTHLRVSDDILIGLHLILLNNFYIKQENLFNLKELDMMKLLENRNDESGNCVTITHLLPQHFKTDFLELLLQDTHGEDDKLVLSSSSMGPFHQLSNGLEFLTEHIVELSEIIPVMSSSKESLDEWIIEQVEQYLTFVSECVDPSVMPTKNIDLVFHFHMLHPTHFVQDSLRLVNRIKSHNFNFKN